MLLNMIRTLQETHPAWFLHVITGEDGPLLASMTGLKITCEALPFPKALHSFGERRRPRGLLTNVW